MRPGPLRAILGFTLIEAMVALFIMSILFTGLFFIFSYASRGFQQANDRMGLLSEANRVRGKVEEDLTLTSYHSTAKVDRTFTDFGATTRRDALAFLSRSDWKATDALDPSTRLPIWDRYTLYSTPQSQERHLTRVVVRPSSAPPDPGGLAIAPFSQLTALLEDVAASDIITRSILSEHLFRFEVDLDDTHRTVLLNVELRRMGGLSATSQNRRDESLQALFRVQPKNNGPGIGG